VNAGGNARFKPGGKGRLSKNSWLSGLKVAQVLFLRVALFLMRRGSGNYLNISWREVGGKTNEGALLRRKALFVLGLTRNPRALKCNPASILDFPQEPRNEFYSKSRPI
jgi:hypothetical protein